VETVTKHIGGNGTAFVDTRPVFADMEPGREHVEELHRRLDKNAKEKEAMLAELAEVQRTYLRVSEKAKNLMRRYGVES
jgi:predicted nuclease with TOPRIM domain